MRVFPKIVWATCLVIAGQLAAAEQSGSESARQASKSVQQQLDELKAGQERLLKEVEQIKAFLQAKQTPANGTNQPAVPNVATANIHGEPFRGTNSAKIAIIEYSDFNCSFCGRYARNVFPQLEHDYVESGKVRYYFRDLPEPMETNSWFKARAARCAGDQAKFWEMHDLLFHNQSAQGGEMVTLASTLGLEMDKFNACLSSEKYLINIQRSAAGAKRMGLYGTPAFLIGPLTEDSDFVRVKKVLVGAQTYESIKAVLDEMLSGESAKAPSK